MMFDVLMFGGKKAFRNRDIVMMRGAYAAV